MAIRAIVNSFSWHFTALVALSFYLLSSALAAAVVDSGVIRLDMSPASIKSGDVSTDQIFKGETSDPYTLALRAFVWGYPIVEAAKIRMLHTNPDDPFSSRPQPSAASALNSLGHGRTLFGPTFRNGVGVNNDTLYSLGWFDMGGEPWVLESPDFGERYYTYSIYGADSSSIDSVGQRTHGGQLPPVFIYGPHYKGPVPDGMLGLRVPTRYMNFAGRVLTTGTRDDYAQVHALQDQIRMRPLGSYQAGTSAPKVAPEQLRLDADLEMLAEPLRFYGQLGNILRDWIPSPDERVLLASFEDIGLGPRGFDVSILDGKQQDALARAARDAQMLIEGRSRQLGVTVNGWTTNYRGSIFGDDYLLRSAVARDQIYVTIPQEAVYPLARTDVMGANLSGCNSYRILLSADALPPVDGFWSITLYDDSGYMVENPVNRYSVGDRTPHLMTHSNGDVEIIIQHHAPEKLDHINWLPAPADEPFYLMMRLYIPGDAVLDQTWLPPTITPIPQANGCTHNKAPQH